MIDRAMLRDLRALIHVRCGGKETEGEDEAGAQPHT
jgi:hypothetical protein